jgi:exonuclease III
MDPKKVLFWNVRDLNSSARQDSVRTLVDASRVDIVCIQETKKYVVTRRTILSSLGSEFSNFFERPFVGASGGILVAWRHNLIFSGEYMV